MSGTRYLVDIQLEVHGELPGKVAAATAGVDKLGGSLSRVSSEAVAFGGKLADAYTGAVERVGALVLNMGKLAAVGVMGGAVYGVTVLNNELEKTQIGIGALLNASGKSSGMVNGMDQAAGLMSQMRKDAAALPGEFSDIATIFKSSASSAFNAGMDPRGLEKLSAQAMAVGAVQGLGSDMVGRELSQLFEGRAGAHNVLGARLGFTGDRAKSLNDASGADRIKMITGEIAKYAPAIDVMATSFQGLTTTTISSLKQVGAAATEPLFERVKLTLMDVNQWFTDNQSRVAAWSERVGVKIADAFEWGKATVLEWYPAIEAFAENAYAKLSEVWKSIGPTVKEIAAGLKDAMGDPGTIDKIIKALELYAGIKIGSGAASLFGGLADAIPKLSGASGAATTAASGAGGIGALAGGALPYAIPALAGGLGFHAGSDFAKTGGDATDYASAAGAIAILTPAMGGLAVGVGYLHEQAIGWGESLRAWADGVDVSTVQSRMLDDIKKQQAEEDAARQLSYAEQYENEMRAAADAQSSSQGAALAADSLASAAAAAAVELRNVANKTVGGGGAGSGNEAGVDDVGYGIGASAMGALFSTANAMNMGAIAGHAVSETIKKTSAGSGKGGGSHAKVDVNITISSNQAPGQIARLVSDKLAQLHRNPTSSAHVRNYSAANRG